MRKSTIRERIRVLAEGRNREDCWLWPGSLRKGYGQTMANLDERGQRNWPAHRAAYVVLRGTIPSGLHLHHECRNTACFNPWHLTPVTPRENTRLDDTPALRNALKTHCKHGHEFTSENTRIVKGCRQCLECERRRSREWMAKNRATPEGRARQAALLRADYAAHREARINSAVEYKRRKRA